MDKHSLEWRIAQTKRRSHKAVNQKRCPVCHKWVSKLGCLSCFINDRPVPLAAEEEQE